MPRHLGPYLVVPTGIVLFYLCFQITAPGNRDEDCMPSAKVDMLHLAYTL
eukprot:EC717798.1.p1 GENE.EC717798.1~~EC717798.1.p1  ORF type:complete len:50 (+),score=5.67 EC717798.1:105-254(+)